MLIAWLKVNLLKKVMCVIYMGEGAGMLEHRILALKATRRRGKNYLKGTEGRHFTLRKLCTSDKQIAQLC